MVFFLLIHNLVCIGLDDGTDSLRGLIGDSGLGG